MWVQKTQLAYSILIFRKVGSWNARSFKRSSILVNKHSLSLSLFEMLNTKKANQEDSCEQKFRARKKEVVNKKEKRSGRSGFKEARGVLTLLICFLDTFLVSRKQIGGGLQNFEKDLLLQSTLPIFSKNRGNGGPFWGCP